MTSLYDNLKLSRGQSKGEALRQAQLKLLSSKDYHHPYYWSPFVLIGNWL
jgi:CHAT domain-containing protein